jgi:hypothetical protein
LSTSTPTKKNLRAGGLTEDVVEAKLWDKNRALEILAKYFKLLVDIVKVEDEDANIAKLPEGRKRVAAARTREKRGG